MDTVHLIFASTALPPVSIRIPRLAVRILRPLVLGDLKATCLAFKASRQYTGSTANGMGSVIATSDVMIPLKHSPSISQSCLVRTPMPVLGARMTQVPASHVDLDDWLAQIATDVLTYRMSNARPAVASATWLSTAICWQLPFALKSIRRKTCPLAFGTQLERSGLSGGRKGSVIRVAPRARSCSLMSRISALALPALMQKWNRTAGTRRRMPINLTRNDYGMARIDVLVWTIHLTTPLLRLFPIHSQSPHLLPLPSLPWCLR
jgi:hypothetical protein